MANLSHVPSDAIGVAPGQQPAGPLSPGDAGRWHDRRAGRDGRHGSRLPRRGGRRLGGRERPGRSIAQAFARRGARVFACDVSPSGLAATAEVPSIETAVVDLTDRAVAAAWVADVEARSGGGIGVLVNNAGGSMGQVPGPIELVSDEDWDRIFTLNVHATFVVCRAAVPAMKRAGRGRIVNISSGAGLKASIHPVQAYGAAKHAVVGMTRLLAAELGRHNITVNSVAPGLVLTNDAREEQWERYGDAGREAILQRLPLRRLATAEDVAKAVLFFASDLAAGVSGGVLQVGGTM